MSLFTASAIGVDVSDGTLKAVALHRRGRRIWLGRTWRLPYFEAPNEEDAAAAALRAFVRSAHPGALPRIVISAPDRQHFSRTYLIPSMEADRVADMARYEALSELGVPADDVVVRHHARKGVVEQQAYTLALQRPRLDAFLAALEESRVPYDQLEAPGFALGSFVEHEIPTGRDRILLGVGQLASHLVLLSEDGIWTRHLRLGLIDAEDPRELAERCAAEIDAAVAFFLPPDRQFQPADVVLTEEGALSGAFTTALKETLGLPITRFRELYRIGTPRRLESGAAGAAQVLSMGKAFGLALAGLDLGRYRCPIVSGSARRNAVRRLPIAAASLLISAAGLAGFTELAEHRVRAVEQAVPATLVLELEEMQSRADDLGRQIRELDATNAALVALAGRRPASFALRRAVALVGELATERGDRSLHLDSAWLAPRTPGHPGLLTLTLHASPALDELVAERLPGALEEAFGTARVRGPEIAPMSGFSRWVAEVDLP